MHSIFRLNAYKLPSPHDGTKRSGGIRGERTSLGFLFLLVNSGLEMLFLNKSSEGNGECIA